MHRDPLPARRRYTRLTGSADALALAVGLAEAVTGQALALAKTPLDLVRGTGGEEITVQVPPERVRGGSPKGKALVAKIKCITLKPIV